MMQLCAALGVLRRISPQVAHSVPAPYVSFPTIAEGGCRHDAQERGEAGAFTNASPAPAEEGPAVRNARRYRQSGGAARIARNCAHVQWCAATRTLTHGRQTFQKGKSSPPSTWRLTANCTAATTPPIDGRSAASDWRPIPRTTLAAWTMRARRVSTLQAPRCGVVRGYPKSNPLT